MDIKKSENNTTPPIKTTSKGPPINKTILIHIITFIQNWSNNTNKWLIKPFDIFKDIMDKIYSYSSQLFAFILAIIIIQYSSIRKRFFHKL